MRLSATGTRDSFAPRISCPDSTETGVSHRAPGRSPLSTRTGGRGRDDGARRGRGRTHGTPWLQAAPCTPPHCERSGEQRSVSSVVQQAERRGCGRAETCAPPTSARVVVTHLSDSRTKRSPPSQSCITMYRFSRTPPSMPIYAPRMASRCGWRRRAICATRSSSRSLDDDDNDDDEGRSIDRTRTRVRRTTEDPTHLLHEFDFDKEVQLAPPGTREVRGERNLHRDRLAGRTMRRAEHAPELAAALAGREGSDGREDTGQASCGTQTGFAAGARPEGARSVTANGRATYSPSGALLVSRS